MDGPESGNHSFVVRLWLEETVAEAGQTVWRGHVTHVLTGDRRYVADLGGITDFIASYLPPSADAPRTDRRVSP